MPLAKTATNILNSFKSLNVSESDKENVESIVKKIRGDKAVKKINPETSVGSDISNSQMSYDNRIANLNILISLIKSHPEYSPNEENIKVASLNIFSSTLTDLSKSVNTAGNALITARKSRNHILYEETNNVIELAKDIKSYLKSLAEPGLPYYKAAVRLKFTDIK